MQNPADVLDAAPRTIAAALLTALLACGGDAPSVTAGSDAGVLPVPPGCPTCAFGDVAVAGTVSDPAIAELSGLAASRRHANVLYTHNDSGDGARFFAIGTDATSRGEFQVLGAKAVDWEDIAVAPCAAGTGAASTCVYLADIGDNALVRSEVVVYRVPEPDLTATAVTAVAFPFRYPDGPHNAETLLADERGEIYVITKEKSGPSVVFSLGIPSDTADATPVTATKIGTFVPPSDGSPLVTGGSFFPDAACPRLVLRTYSDVLFFQAPAPPAGQNALLALLGAGYTKLPPLFEGQGEAVAFSADGRAVYAASEGVSVPLHRYLCE
jgi:hypothetical protein